MDQFFFNFLKTRALKVIITIPSVFTFCKVYLQYVIIYQRGVRPQPMAMEQFSLNIHFHKTMALKVIKTIPSVFTFWKVYLQCVEEIYYNGLQRNSFHKTRALKVNKTIPSVFTFCKVYHQYVEEIYYNRSQWNSFPLNIHFHKTRALKVIKISAVLSHFVRFISSK